MEEYEDRNILLAKLGFKDYKVYLRSSLWKSIRERKIEIDPDCYACEKDADHAQIQIHHGKYTEKNLTGESLDDLYTLCSRCHRWCEVSKTGFKRTPKQATIEMHKIRKMMIKRKQWRPDGRAVNIITRLTLNRKYD